MSLKEPMQRRFAGSVAHVGIRSLLEEPPKSTESMAPLGRGMEQWDSTAAGEHIQISAGINEVTYHALLPDIVLVFSDRDERTSPGDW